ncbi:MAG: esterase/lipase family protein [Phycisphaerales bacterium]
MQIIERINRALSSPRRNLMLSAVLVTIGLVAIVIGNWRVGRQQVDQMTSEVTGEVISSVMGASNQVLMRVFGDEGLGSVPAAWTGLRVYVPGENDWRVLDEGDGPGERVVLLVHGLDEPGGIWDDLAPELSEAGFVVVRFEYLNDQAIGLSGDALGDALDNLQAVGVRRMDLVCHSMGGLVARDALTREGFEQGDGVDGLRVGRLITVGTPHGGSPWARLRAVAEMREQVQRFVEADEMDPMQLLGFVRDGVGKAGEDLMPGSAFLTDLDGRRLDDSIQVTCLVGRVVEPEAVQWGAMVGGGVLGELIGKREVSVIETELDELNRGLGDGVVPMSSAVLDGVDDVVILGANHRGMVRRVEIGEAVRRVGGLGAGDEPPGIAVILDRLGDPLGDDED